MKKMSRKSSSMILTFEHEVECDWLFLSTLTWPIIKGGALFWFCYCFFICVGWKGLGKYRFFIHSVYSLLFLIINFFLPNNGDLNASLAVFHKDLKFFFKKKKTCVCVCACVPRLTMTACSRARGAPGSTEPSHQPAAAREPPSSVSNLPCTRGGTGGSTHCYYWDMSKSHQGLNWLGERRERGDDRSSFWN